MYSALLGAATGLPFSVLVLFLQDRGFPLATVALLTATFQVTSAAFELPTGVLSDRISHKGTLTASAVCFVLTCASLYFGAHPAVAALAMVLLGLTLSLESGTIQAFLHDTLKEAGAETEFSRVVAGYMATKWFAMLGAALVASLTTRWAGLRAVVLVAGVLAILAAVTGLLLREPAFLAEVRQRRASLGGGLTSSLSHISESLGSITRSPVLRNLLFLRVALSQAIAFATGFLVQPFLQFFTWPAHQVALAVGMLQAVQAVTASLSGRILTRFRERTDSVALLMSLLGVAALSIFAFAPTAVFLLIGAGLLKVVNGVFQPFAARIVSDRVDSSHRASVFSINQMGFSASAILVAPLFGRIADAYSVPLAARTFLAVFCVLIALTAWRTMRAVRWESPGPRNAGTAL